MSSAPQPLLGSLKSDRHDSVYYDAADGTTDEERAEVSQNARRCGFRRTGEERKGLRHLYARRQEALSKARLQHTGNDPSDAPLGDAFLQRKSFYRDLLASSVIAVIIGLVAFFFFEAVYRSQSYWIGSNPDAGGWYSGFPEEPSSVCVGCGKIWWLFITAGGGCLLGLFKIATSYPQGETQTFFEEILAMEVHWHEGFLTAIGGFISLMSGASLGPEASIGAFGGALGAWFSDVFDQDTASREVWTMSGMSAAMGSLFASPVLSVSLILELANVHRSRYMEVIVILYTSAVIAFSIYISLAANPNFFIKQTLAPGESAEYLIGWNIMYIPQAIPLGVVSGIIGLITLIFQGICNKIVQELELRLSCYSEATYSDYVQGRSVKINRKASLLIIPVLGGFIIGAIGIYLPLTIGDGQEALGAILGDGYKSYWKRQVLEYGNTTIDKLEALKDIMYRKNNASIHDGWPNPAPEDRSYSTELILLTMVFKMISFAVSSSFGFIGGIMFPFFFIGACAGNVAAQLTGINQSFACMAMMLATPTAFSPVPFLFLVLGVMLFGLTAYQTSAIFLCMLVSYCTVSGSGVLLKAVSISLPQWLDKTPSIKEQLVLVREKVGKHS